MSNSRHRHRGQCSVDGFEHFCYWFAVTTMGVGPGDNCVIFFGRGSGGGRGTKPGFVGETLTMRAIFIATLAVPCWFGVLFITGDHPLVPRSFALSVLIAMTLTIYVLIRRWRDALPTAALLSGVIAFLALLMAAITAG
jgi:hypothetical protein